MKKSLIAVAASLAMAATFTATAPVAASAAGNDHVELCRPLVDAQIFGSLGECVSLVRTAPVQLINLGSAYAQVGDTEKAAQYYGEAAASERRYQLELADGSWVDSRRAARTALLRLEEARLAMN